MRVEVKLFASLKRNYPSGMSDERVVELESGTSVARLLDMLDIPRKAAKIILRNGRHAEPEDILEDGDRLAIFPPIAGG
ncbi:MAG: MoaD/ThiS family protein [Deltaproteobacteria bacterium]|nr:MoaD/ThiS family protein [Deltaproteobacteria bacterium]